MYDAKRPYLALRVWPGGAKTFILYRRVRGAAKKIRIGRLGELTVREARARADELNAKIARGDDPTPDRLGPRTLGDVFADYMEKHSKVRKKTWRQDEKIYARFGWEITPEYSRFLDAQQENARAYKSEHRYQAGLGPPRETLHTELAHLFERFGWEKE